jgi:hypothetical protein
MLAVLGKLSKRVLMEGITPCPASTAGFFSIIRHNLDKINRINNIFKKNAGWQGK